jgi:hypothetical protein
VDGLIGHAHMQRLAVGIGIDGNRGDAHLARRLYDATGNLATIGDQDFGEHADVIPRSTVPFMACACRVKPTMQITVFQSICDSNSAPRPSLGTSFQLIVSIKPETLEKIRIGGIAR